MKTAEELYELIMGHPQIEGDGPILTIVMCPSKGLILRRHASFDQANAATLDYLGPKWMFEVGRQLENECPETFIGDMIGLMADRMGVERPTHDTAG